MINEHLGVASTQIYVFFIYTGKAWENKKYLFPTIYVHMYVSTYLS